MHKQLAQETSTPDSGKLFAMRFPSRESNDRFAYIDTYNDVLRYDSDDEKRGLSGKSIYIAVQRSPKLIFCMSHAAIMRIRNVTDTTNPRYRLSTIVNPLSFLTPVGNSTVNGYQLMGYSYVRLWRGWG